MTLTIEGKNAVLERKWSTGKEQLQGSVSRGQPLKLEGLGWFFNNEAGAWKTSVTLVELGPRFEGAGTIESRDGKTKYRDCTVSVVDVVRMLEKEAAPRASAAEQSAHKTNNEPKEKRPIAPIKQAEPTKLEPKRPVAPITQVEPPKVVPKLQPVEEAKVEQATPLVPTPTIPSKETISPPDVAASAASQPPSISQPVAASAPVPMQTSSTSGNVGSKTELATASISANASNNGPFGIGAILLAVLGGMAITIFALLGFRRFKSSLPRQTKRNEADFESTTIIDQNYPVVDRNAKSEQFELLENDPPDQSLKIRSERTDASPAKIKTKGKGLLSNVVNGIAILILVGGAGFMGKYWIEKDVLPSSNKTSSDNKSSDANLSRTSSLEKSIQRKLRDLAIKDLHESKYSGARPDALCDTLSQEMYEPVSYGRISNAPEVLGEKKALPAIVVRHQYLCINNTFGTKENQEQWVILALDEEFSKIRCIRTGPLFLVHQIAEECGFVADDLKSPFPSPEIIANSAPESLRPQVLERLRSSSASGVSPTPTASAAENKTEAVGRISTPLILTCQISRETAKRYFFLSDGVILEESIMGQNDKSYTFMWIAGVYEREENSFKVRRTATYKSFEDVEREIALRSKEPVGPPTKWEPMDKDVNSSYKISLEPNQKAKISNTEHTVDGVSQIKDIGSYNCINESKNVEIKKKGETILALVPSQYFGVKKSSEPSTTSKHSKGPGSNSVEDLASKGKPIYYNFQAQKGVDIRLSVESEREAVVFHLYPPSAAALIAKNIVPPNRITTEPMRQFNYQATESGAYVVGVGFPRGESVASANFKLSIRAQEGLGNLLPGVGSSEEPEKSASSKISTNGCTVLPTMDGGRPITLTASQAWEEMISARERAIRDQNLARSKNDFCRLSADHIVRAISNIDEHLVTLKNNKYLKDEDKAGPALVLCHAYANSARPLAGCK